MLLVIGDVQHETVVDFGQTPARGATAPARISHRRGGSGGNIAAFAAQAGSPTRIAGQVGVDHLGAFLIEDLRAHGVDVRLTRRGRSASAVLVRSPSVATHLVDRAAATQLTTFEADLLDEVTLLHLSANSLTVEPLATATFDLVGEAIDAGITVTVDACGVHTIEEYGSAEMRGLIAQLQPHAFFCSRSESEALGLRGCDPIPGARSTVITAGPRPALLLTPNGTARSFPVPPVIDAVDDDGVGDAFVTGFLLGRLAGQDAETCMKAGHLLASRVLRHAGARLSAPAIDVRDSSRAASATASSR